MSIQRYDLDGAPSADGPWVKHDDHLAAVAELEARLENERWRSAEDELPFPGVVVLVAGGIGYIRGDAWYSLTSQAWPGRPIQWEVTHWRPMPEPPKEAGA